MNQDQAQHAKLLREAFDQYLSHLYETPLEPAGKISDYDFSFVCNRKWHSLAEEMVVCDLRQLTNLVNGWAESLCRWHAWSYVLADRDRQEAWELRSEFLDALVHKCLLMPASIRDAITSVATSAFHQARLSTDRTYRDNLEGDPRDPKTPEEKTNFSRRGEKEKYLSKIVRDWPSSNRFLEALRQINTSAYIQATRNYRNLTAHSIAPKFEFGHTRTVQRSVRQFQTIENSEDGRIILRDVPGKLTVSYSYGGTPPLNLETIRAANLGQFERAHACYSEYRALLEAVVKAIEPDGQLDVND